MVLHVEKLLTVLFISSVPYLLHSPHGCCASEDPFIVQPTNQTAAYGESVTFECHVLDPGCSHTLMFLVNDKSLSHLNLSSVYFKKSNMLLCDEGQQVAMLSIIVNNKTLEAVKYVSCNLTVTGELRDISSSRAYIIDINVPYLLLTTCPQCSAPAECPNVKSMSYTSSTQKEQLSIAQIIMLLSLSISLLV